MRKLPTTLLLLLTLLAAAGCNLNTEQTPPTGIPADETAVPSVQTYVDQLSGIAFDYPDGWTVSPPPPEDAAGYAITLASYNFLDPNQPGVGGMPAGETKVDVTFALPGSTVSDVRDQIETDVSGGFITLLEEQDRTFGDGASGLFIRGTDTFNTEFSQIIREVGERVVQITQYGPGDTLDLIAGSMRAVSPTGS
ncbi:MAG: hypothetical protein KJ065_06930 [Anaerolineae bacterium]|nr:hypothetical protein [Anaerolineae bacterium]